MLPAKAAARLGHVGTEAADAVEGRVGVRMRGGTLAWLLAGRRLQLRRQAVEDDKLQPKRDRKQGGRNGGLAERLLGAPVPPERADAAGAAGAGDG